MLSYFLYFLTGGLFTILVVGLEESGFRTLSGFAAIMPVFTLVGYLFLGQAKGGGVAVGQHAWFVLVGSLLAWVPYMFTVAILAPKIGTKGAIGYGLAVFFVLAFFYLYFVNLFHLFQK